MAGEWIKVTLELPDKPEVHYIANALNLDPDAVVGKLIRVWAWFDKNTRDGNAFGVTFALLDRITSVTGFGEAMSLAGWMEQRDKTLVMPNFERHNAESSKKRALTAKRVEKFRNAKSVTSALPEKRREEKNIKTNTTPVAPLPDWVDKEKWEAYVKSRSAKTRTPEALKAAIEKLEGFRALGFDGNEIIATSLANGWQGLFAPKSNGGGNGKSKFNPVQYVNEQFAKELDAGASQETVDDLHGKVHPLLPR